MADLVPYLPNSYYTRLLPLRVDMCRGAMRCHVKLSTYLGIILLPALANACQHAGRWIYKLQAGKSPPRSKAQHGMESILRRSRSAEVTE